MKLISSICLSDYKKRQRYTISKHLKQLSALNIKTYPVMSASSVYSSLIEGSGIDIQWHYLSYSYYPPAFQLAKSIMLNNFDFKWATKNKDN